MNKNTKKLLALSFMAIFIVSTVSVAFLGGGRITPPPDKNTETTITGTPADNYKDTDRPTFCGTNQTKSTKYITEFKIPTICTQPLAIIVDQSGGVWFTESNTGNLGKFDLSSKSFQEFTNQQWQKGEKSMMWGLANSQDGNIWITDSQHNLIWKFNPSDKSYQRFAFPKSNTQDGSFPQMILIDGKNAYVNDFTGRKIGVFSTDHTGPDLGITNIPSPGDQNFTSSMITDTVGKLWYTVWKYQQGGDLVSYDKKTGNYTQYLLPQDIQAPNGITIDSSGKLWIMDTASSYFFDFDPASKKFTKHITSPPPVSSYGNASGLIKTPITRPYWTHFDDNGRLWFNEQVANSLGVYDPSTQSLVEYAVPSKNPNWSDCGTLSDCGVAQVLDFTVDHNKVWFTEWVENNIGVLDSSVPLPINVTTDPSIVIHHGQNATVSLNISPQESLDSPVSIITSNTAGPQTISITPQQTMVTVDKPQTVKLTISADNFAMPGTYQILLSARYHDITVSKYVNITLE
ncbi:MAG TPA: lyase [Candidatus Nitrosotalea sp.]|nr:lyase [Candidatus Nitrosotalea sp.]